MIKYSSRGSAWSSSKSLGTITGYLHPGYAQSLAEFGTPRELPQSRGWIMAREIPGFPYQDAMGCYPIFACQDWSQLHADLEDIGNGNELVSLPLVTDPFGKYDLAYLRQCFRDVIVAFKAHFIIDQSRRMDTFVCQHQT